jgi:hypothetical protein
LRKVAKEKILAKTDRLTPELTTIKEKNWQSIKLNETE